TRTNRKRKPCSRFVRAGAFAHAARAGSNRKGFSGRIGAKRLAPGSYRVTLVATDAAGNKSEPQQFAFTLVRR
ncbi:MAG: Bacterial Ig-like domain, partial [Thermoleophilaceae bacterium]|nr:Bacterial Ig-like domain [Thermoleophilaceae bacterium]